MRAQGSARTAVASCCDRTRAQARVWLKVRDGHDKRAPLSASERRGGGSWRARGLLGRGKKEAKQVLGWAARWKGRKEKKGQRRREGIRERESGPGPKRKKGEKKCI
jgi:hypothetical protein